MQLIYMLLLPALAAFLLNLIITPILIKLSHKNQWYDDIDHRKIHTEDTPRIGGVGIFGSLAVVYLVGVLLNTYFDSGFFSVSWITFGAFFLSILLTHIVGLIDDFSNIKPRFKLIIQLLAGFIAVFAGFRFQVITIPFVNMTWTLPWILSILLSMFWLIGISNAVNLIDGMDGQSGTISLTVAAGLLLFSYLQGAYFQAFIAALAIGAVLAFLVYNFPPAKIFMGDSGSLFMGFLLALIPLTETAQFNGGTIWVAITLLLIPIGDTFAAIIRRKRRNVPFFIPDRDHMHHKLLDKGISNKLILCLLGFIQLVLCASIVFWTLHPGWFSASIIGLLWVAMFIYFERLGTLKK